jgi:hypothetical protein
MTTHGVFLAGMVTAALLVSSLFFFRFWRRTQDRLFLAFGIAFLLFTANQALVGLSGFPREDLSVFYLLRLCGFVVIIAAIVAKNLQAKRSVPLTPPS